MNAADRKNQYDSLSARLRLLKEQIRIGMVQAGLDAYHEGNYALARERMEQLLKLDPHNEQAWGLIVELSRKSKERTLVGK